MKASTEWKDYQTTNGLSFASEEGCLPTAQTPADMPDDQPGYTNAVTLNYTRFKAPHLGVPCLHALLQDLPQIEIDGHMERCHLDQASRFRLVSRIRLLQGSNMKKWPVKRFKPNRIEEAVEHGGHKHRPTDSRAIVSTFQAMNQPQIPTSMT